MAVMETERQLLAQRVLSCVEDILLVVFWAILMSSVSLATQDLSTIEALATAMVNANLAALVHTNQCLVNWVACRAQLDDLPTLKTVTV